VEALTPEQIKRAMVNCSRGDVASMSLPPGFADLDWESLEFLGWRDPRAPLRGYLLSWHGDRPVGILLRAAASKMSVRTAAVCMLCRTGQSADNISLFTTRRAGPAGRKGDTVGTYVCADLACSRNARVDKATASFRPDPGRTVEERVAGLRARLDTFLDAALAS
jgi:FBP C-terminal treble-clef zinc-finger